MGSTFKALNGSSSLVLLTLLAAAGCAGDSNSTNRWTCRFRRRCAPARVTGSYLAALTIYGGLTGEPTLGLPGRLRLRSGTEIEIDPAAAPLLQAAADKARGR